MEILNIEISREFNSLYAIIQIPVPNFILGMSDSVWESSVLMDKDYFSQVIWN